MDVFMIVKMLQDCDLEFFMMKSSNANIFRVTNHLCGEFTGHRWIPRAKASDAELWFFSLICAWINGWVNNREAGDLRRHRARYDVSVMHWEFMHTSPHFMGPPLSCLRTLLHNKAEATYRLVLLIVLTTQHFNFQTSHLPQVRLDKNALHLLGYIPIFFFKYSMQADLPWEIISHLGLVIKFKFKLKLVYCLWSHIGDITIKQ